MAWICDSNEAISLVQRRDEPDAEALCSSSKSEQALIQPYHPAFTYSIFGDDQKIFGYKNLKVQLNLTSGSLYQFLSVTYDAKIGSSATPADDISLKLADFLAPDHTTSSAEFDARLKADALSFKPFGTKIGEYSRPTGEALERKKAEKGRKRKFVDPDEEDGAVDQGESDSEVVVYELWKTSLSDPDFRKYHRRMQILVPLYIEGGQYVEEDDDRWEFIISYEKRRRPTPTTSKKTAGLSSSDSPKIETIDRSEKEEAWTYHFVGYTSLYPFFHYPDMIRLRLSQFIVLPAYHGQGHGSALYSAVYAYTLTISSIAELTIEDPSEIVDDLRDICDLRMLERLVKKGEFDGKLKLDRHVGVDKAWLEAKRKELKLAKRQFQRLYEILLLHVLDPKDRIANKAYRLFVKERLYRFNYDQLSQIDQSERIEKLRETFNTVEDHYVELLDRARLDPFEC
ncbi:histone acetyltransferase type b catalytic subunit [Phaffia rhodozyma]|uniref:Histone acetyltransferase type B catalytic subunit n=1 Tax=Phaffia rhodozyma TaxID=264483 RepID=A0A0F7SU85_PHARH|nr:histone acetyltransferase type b catalytic subunit [Phaffia rhodozyma]